MDQSKSINKICLVIRVEHSITISPVSQEMFDLRGTRLTKILKNLWSPLGIQ